jgi:hypothetical protein
MAADKRAADSMGDLLSDCNARPAPKTRQFVISFDGHLDEQSRTFATPLGISARVDPRLPTALATRGSKTVVLLGLAVDAAHPEHDEAAIAESLLHTCGEDPVSLARACDSLAGRFVVLFEAPTSTWVLPDATGLRGTVYGSSERRGLWCASDATLLAPYLECPPDDELGQHLDGARGMMGDEWWWMGNRTLAGGVVALMANHALDVRQGSSVRTWPLERRAPRSAAEVAGLAADMLRSLCTTAARRWRIALPLTAGWDSRLLLASLKGVQDVWLYTVQHRDDSATADDIRIAAELAAIAGLDHHVITPGEEMGPEFREAYMAQTSDSHPFWGGLTESLMGRIPSEAVCMKGAVSEVAKQFYGGIADQRVDARLILGLTRQPATRFALDQAERWVEIYRRLSDSTDYRILDLFQWEHQVGRREAQSQLETDMVHDTFNPYSCHGLLELLLSTTSRARRAPRYELYGLITQRLWPELLRVPVNPGASRVKPVVKRLAEPWYVAWKRRSAAAI